MDSGSAVHQLLIRSTSILACSTGVLFVRSPTHNLSGLLEKVFHRPDELLSPNQQCQSTITFRYNSNHLSNVMLQAVKLITNDGVNVVMVVTLTPVQLHNVETHSN